MGWLPGLPKPPVDVVYSILTPVLKIKSFLATAITVYISTSQPDNKNTQI